MPLLDMSDVLTDLDFLDTLTLTRNTQTVVNGYGVNAPISSRIYGVVTSATGKALDRLPEAKRMEQNILVITKTLLTSGNDTLDADVVTWNSLQYTVSLIDDYSRYGQGFIQAICTLIPVSG